jgi:hypothetical protein
MSGITVGPRQFNMMVPGQLLGGNGITTPLTPWSWLDGGSGSTYWISTKLDLRGLNAGSDSSRGLSPISIQLQESCPWYQTTTVPDPYYPSFLVYDLLTTVPLNQATIDQIFRYPFSSAANATPGFLAMTDQTPFEMNGIKQQYLNTSQVIYGRWRQMTTNTVNPQGSDKFGMSWGQSSTFGSGEIMVSNDAYYTRVIITSNDGDSVMAPSVNLAVWGEIVSLSEGQELTQLSRMVQR